MASKRIEIKYADIQQLNLDPKNPRLGRRVASDNLKQDVILDEMSDWTLEELAVSFLESGFWPQESLLVVEEDLYSSKQLVVIEGNRRLAALKLLHKTINGELKSKKWIDLVGSRDIPEELFEQIPYILVPSRKEVSAYLGFRHVTGIKEWNPAEKAQYIAKLIDEEGLSYDEVRRRIGSKAPTVRQHYISYNLLLQMDNQEEISIEAVEDKFSVLYLSLRTQGVQNYLNIDINADPEKAKKPVPQEHLNNLINFARWLFGDEKKPPLISDSRNVDNFGKILESEEAVEYLERADDPRFEIAYRKAGVGEQDVISLIESASDNIQLALTEAHLFSKSERLQKATKRLGMDVFGLLNVFPAIKQEIIDEMIQNASST